MDSIEEQFLSFLRGGMRSEGLAGKQLLISDLKRAHPEICDMSIDQTAQFLRRCILKALQQDDFTADERISIQIMLGIERRGDRSEPRKEITRRMGIELGRPGFPLSRRRVEQIERSTFSPRLLRRVLESSDNSDSAQRIPWRNCHVHVRLGPEASIPGVVRYRYQLRFQSIEDRILIGVTEDDLIADYLCSQVTGMTEVIVPGVGRSGTESFSIYEISNGVRSRHLEMRPADLPTGIRADAGPVSFYRSPSTSRDVLEFEFTCLSELNIDEGVTYWTAARSLYLAEVIIDYSAFPERERYLFKLYSTMGVPIRVFNQPDHGIYTIQASQWINPGNGFQMTWLGR